MNFGKIAVAVTVSLFLSVGYAVARPAFPGLVSSEQPDGTVVKVRKVGDEHFHFTETEDGIVVVRDSLGFWTYADEDGKSSGVRSHAVESRDEAEQKFLKSWNSEGIRDVHRAKVFKRKRMGEPELAPRDESLVVPMLRPGRTKLFSDYVAQPTYATGLVKGNVHGLVILVQFSDVSFKMADPKDFYYRFMNEEGFSEYHNVGSARDYFIANSDSVFTPNFDVIGPFTLSKKRDSYGSLAHPEEQTLGALEALNEAFEQLMASGTVDMKQYDNDGDGYVDFIYMIYAGVGAADSGVESAIWPHAGVFIDPSTYNTWMMNYKKVTNGLKMYKYACSNEISGAAYQLNRNTSAVDGVGAFAHEFSHVLGLMDSYDIYYSDENAWTPGHYDLMDYGTYLCPSNRDAVASCAPPYMTAFERYSLGWLTPRTLSETDTAGEIMKISKNDGLVLPSPDKNEYFMLDYHTQEGFDKALPNHGMLVWRIAYNDEAWSQNEVNVNVGAHRVKIIPAKEPPMSFMGVRSWDYVPFPGTGKVTSFSDFKTLSGVDLGVELSNMTETDSSIVFNVRYTGGSLVFISSSSEILSSSSSAAVSSSSEIVVLSSSSRGSSSSSFFVWPWGKSSSSEALLNTSSSKTEKLVVSAAELDGKLSLEGSCLRVFDMQGRLLLEKKIVDAMSKADLAPYAGRGPLIVQWVRDGKIVETTRVARIQR